VSQRNARKWKVLCNDELWFERDTVLEPLADIATIDHKEARYDLLLETIGEYDAYYASASVKTDKRVLNMAKQLKVIATPSTGTDHIDVDAARAKGITILDLAKEFELLDTFSATAEHAWCLLLALVRNLPASFEATKNGHWERQKYAGVQLMGKTLGVLGYGRLGRMVAEIGRGFRMNVIACDIKKITTGGIRQVDFNTLLSESDVLSVHIHLTRATRSMLSKDAFARMKRGILVINTSRGALIDESALLEALRSKQVAGAGLDVIHGEWSENLREHPLIEYARKHDNLIITPHIGGSTLESIVGARKFMAQKLADYLASLT